MMSSAGWQCCRRLQSPSAPPVRHSVPDGLLTAECYRCRLSSTVPFELERLFLVEQPVRVGLGEQHRPGQADEHGERGRHSSEPEGRASRLEAPVEFALSFVRGVASPSFCAKFR